MMSHRVARGCLDDIDQDEQKDQQVVPIGFERLEIVVQETEETATSHKILKPMTAVTGDMGSGLGVLWPLANDL
jgi:hypothetical protein